MTDDELHEPPDVYEHVHGHSAAQEASGGTSGALREKIIYIDEAMTKLENTRLNTENPRTRTTVLSLLVQYNSLEAWFDVIEAELDNRAASL